MQSFFKKQDPQVIKRFSHLLFPFKLFYFVTHPNRRWPSCPWVWRHPSRGLSSLLCKLGRERRGRTFSRPLGRPCRRTSASGSCCPPASPRARKISRPLLQWPFPTFGIKMMLLCCISQIVLFTLNKRKMFAKYVRLYIVLIAQTLVWSKRLLH